MRRILCPRPLFLPPEVAVTGGCFQPDRRRIWLFISVSPFYVMMVNTHLISWELISEPGSSGSPRWRWRNWEGAESLNDPASPRVLLPAPASSFPAPSSSCPVKVELCTRMGLIPSETRLVGTSKEAGFAMSLGRSAAESGVLFGGEPGWAPPEHRLPTIPGRAMAERRSLSRSRLGCVPAFAPCTLAPGRPQAALRPALAASDPGGSQRRGDFPAALSPVAGQPSRSGVTLAEGKRAAGSGAPGAFPRLHGQVCGWRARMRRARLSLGFPGPSFPISRSLSVGLAPPPRGRGSS